MLTLAGAPANHAPELTYDPGLPLAEMLQTRGGVGAEAVLGLQQLHLHTRSEERENARARTGNNTILSGPALDQLDLTCFYSNYSAHPLLHKARCRVNSLGHQGA